MCSQGRSQTKAVKMCISASLLPIRVRSNILLSCLLILSVHHDSTDGLGLSTCRLSLSRSDPTILKWVTSLGTLLAGSPFVNNKRYQTISWETLQSTRPRNLPATVYLAFGLPARIKQSEPRTVARDKMLGEVWMYGLIIMEKIDVFGEFIKVGMCVDGEIS